MTTLREELQKESDELLLDALAETAARAKEKIVKQQDFSVENVIPLLLLSQYNHIAHLDTEITAIKQGLKDSEQRLEQKMDLRFERVDQRFEKIDQRFGKIDERFVEVHQSISAIHDQISHQTKWMFGMGAGIVAILSGLITFLKFG